MNINIKNTENGLHIILAGELDHHAAKTVLKEISDSADELMPTACVLDMTGVGFMDSSGIAVVLGLYRRMEEVGGRLEVRHVPEQAMRVFRAAGLERIVHFK